jgi:hypothetical protein
MASRDPDFWMSYAGGQLPMMVINMEVTTEGGPYGEIREVGMTIRAVSCGAPVMPEDDQSRPKELP